MNLMAMSSPPALDIALLRSFLLVAECRSFTRAAARVGRTQSAVSLQVRRLESLIGHRLFERGAGGGVRLTREGERLQVGARELTTLSDDIVGSFRSEPRPERSALSRAARPKPSVAVLPFLNMSNDPEQDYFTDGMHDSLVTGLSRIKWLHVVARHSTRSYKGATVDAQRAGRDLGARYVLEGGVLRAGRRLRVAARLIEVETGAHLWADQYDGGLDGVFDLQDRIVDQVVGIVEPNVQRSEIRRSRQKRAENLDAHDLYLRALPHIAAQMPHEAKIALPLLRQALKLDADYPAAHALIAWCHELCFARGGFDAADRDAGLEHARAAISSETDDAATLALAGFAMTWLREREAGPRAIDKALALNPSCAKALYLGAQAYAVANNNQTAAYCAGRALQLSPFDPLAFQAHLGLGFAAFQEERLDDAAVCNARAVRANSSFSLTHIMLAIAQILAGREDEARRAARRGMELEPGFRVRMFYEFGLERDILKRVAEGSRMLGFPA
jgi:adenylate cyclase